MTAWVRAFFPGGGIELVPGPPLADLMVPTQAEPPYYRLVRVASRRLDGLWLAVYIRPGAAPCPFQVDTIRRLADAGQPLSEANAWVRLAQLSALGFSGWRLEDDALVAGRTLTLELRDGRGVRISVADFEAQAARSWGDLFARKARRYGQPWQVIAETLAGLWDHHPTGLPVLDEAAEDQAPPRAPRQAADVYVPEWAVPLAPPRRNVR